MSEDFLLYKVLIVDDHFLPQQIVANVIRALKTGGNRYGFQRG